MKRKVTERKQIKSAILPIKYQCVTSLGILFISYIISLRKNSGAEEFF